MIPLNTPLVRVYGRTGCPPCKATTLKMASLGLGSSYIDVETDLVAKAELEQRGFQSLPVVIVAMSDGGEYAWSGFRPDKIDELAKQMAAAA